MAIIFIRYESKAKIAIFALLIIMIFLSALIFPSMISASSSASSVSSLSKVLSSADDPAVITDSDDIRDISRKGMVSAGLYHTVLLSQDGQVYCWGDNSYGQLGIGTVESEDSPTLVPDLANIVMVSAGAYHSIALSGDGNVYVWGRNTFGQIGDGTSIASPSPILVDNIPPIKEIAAGAFHSMAMSNDGAIYAWGNNNDLQVGDVLSENITDETGNILGKRVVTPQIVVASGAKAISAGGSHSLYLDGSGQVYSWGDNSSGQLGDGGQVSHSLPEPVTGLTAVTSISAGFSHNLAISEKTATEGTSTETYQNLYVWGSDSDGQLGLGNTPAEKAYVDRPTRVDITKDIDETNDRISLIEAGYSNSMITVPEIKEEKRYDSLYIWGNNTYGQLGIGDLPSQSIPVVLIATANGWTGNTFLPFQSVAIGGYHIVFLSVKGFVGTVGRANKGQLGNVSIIDCDTPTGVIVKDSITPEWTGSEEVEVATSGQTVTVKWEKAYDNINVTGYEASYIGEDKSLKSRLILKALQYTINDFDFDTTQTISIKAVDKAGNRSINPLEHEYINPTDIKSTFSSPVVSSVSSVASSSSTVPSPADDIKADPLWWSPELYGTITPLEVPWDVDYIYGAGVIKPPEDNSWLIALGITAVTIAFFMFLGITAFKKKNRGHRLFGDLIKVKKSSGDMEKPEVKDSGKVIFKAKGRKKAVKNEIPLDIVHIGESIDVISGKKNDANHKSKH